MYLLHGYRYPCGAADAPHSHHDRLRTRGNGVRHLHVDLQRAFHESGSRTGILHRAVLAGNGDRNADSNPDSQLHTDGDQHVRDPAVRRRL